MHIGGYDYSADGDFKWIARQRPLELGSTHWLSNNPRGGGRRCLALQMWDWERFGQWADSFCWISLPFVCEVMTAPPNL